MDRKQGSDTMRGFAGRRAEGTGRLLRNRAMQLRRIEENSAETEEILGDATEWIKAALRRR